MKNLSLLLALCLTLSIFAGCAKPADPTTVPTTLPAVTTAPTEAPTETTVPPTEPPAPKVVDFALDAPEGFFSSVVQDTVTVLTSPNAPMDTSTITVEVLPMNPDVLNLSEEEFESKVTRIPVEETEPTEETAETDASEETTVPEESTEPTGPREFDLLNMEQIELDGWPTLVCEYDLIFDGYASHVTRYEAVVNEANYVFTFTDNTDSNVWLEDFAASGDSIDLILDTDGVELNYSNLTLYNLDGGLSIYAEGGMEAHQAEGFTACIGNRNVIILMMADDKESNNLTAMEPEDYAELLRSTNDLDEFRSDIYGNLYTTFFSTDENGMEYYNMICVKETDDDFWVVQFACASDDQAAYAKAFNLWASSISEN